MLVWKKTHNIIHSCFYQLQKKKCIIYRGKDWMVKSLHNFNLWPKWACFRWESRCCVSIIIFQDSEDKIKTMCTFQKQRASIMVSIRPVMQSFTFAHKSFTCDGHKLHLTHYCNNHKKTHLSSRTQYFETISKSTKVSASCQTTKQIWVNVLGMVLLKMKMYYLKNIYSFSCHSITPYRHQTWPARQNTWLVLMGLSSHIKLGKNVKIIMGSNAFFCLLSHCAVPYQV